MSCWLLLASYPIFDIGYKRILRLQENTSSIGIVPLPCVYVEVLNNVKDFLSNWTSERRLREDPRCC